MLIRAKFDRVLYKIIIIIIIIIINKSYIYNFFEKNLIYIYILMLK